MDDPEQSRRVLRRLFLTLFLRGRSARGMRGAAAGAPKSVGQKLALTLVLYAAFGAIALVFRGQPVFSLSLYLHGLTLVFLGMFVGTSAGEVLFNMEEGDILLHRPIDPSELLWAKIAVLVQVSLWLAGAFNLVGFGVDAWGEGTPWFILAHAVSLTLEALFCTGGVVLMYQLCLRWCGREKLDAVLTAVQTLVAIAAVLAGQIVPRLLIYVGSGLEVNPGRWWIMLLPPAWFASLDDALVGTHRPLSFGLGAAGLLLTALVLWLAFAKLAQSYGAGLQLLGEAPAPAVGSGRSRGRWLEMVTRTPPLSWIQRDPVEQASFRLTAAYLFRDRETKLRLYPGIAPVFIVPVILLVPFGSHHASSLEASSFQIAFAGGYLGIVPLLALNMLQYSQQWPASDVFRYAPMAGPGPLAHGARRAVLFFLGAPAALCFAAAIWFFTHDAARLLLLLPGVMTLPLCALGSALGGQGTPLSRPTEEGKASGRGLVTFFFMIPSLAVSLLASVAMTAGWFWPFVAAEAVILTGLYVALRAVVSRSRWTSVE